MQLTKRQSILQLNFDALLKQTQQVFDQYDLKFNIEKMSIINYTDNEAQVYLTQTTEKVRGHSSKIAVSSWSLLL